MDLDRFHATAEELLFNNPLPLSGYSYKESSFNMKGAPELGSFTDFHWPGNYTDHASSQCADHCGCCKWWNLMKPYLLDRVVSAGGEEVKKFLPTSGGTLMTATEAANLTD